ncbi:cell wall hydrolase [Phenylobacterium aquaticum]|uniref:cell wall hydrolase n=1 Tax=Phenylobacterium aquaticum TaxID=1763816 RepID=UPI001F5C63D2|nr:cell wall hydrolase [Phenylobacterium aquaticum]MCI3132330.1 cell wall hydrolase [Phenylobacterium aquaticum]
MSPLRTLPTWSAALRGLAVLLAGAVVAACASAYLPSGSGRAAGVVTVAETFSEQGLKRLTADMDPAMLALARRHDPVRHTDYWDRPLGWEVLDLAHPPDLGFGTATDDAALEINALRPFSRLPIRPMKPFVLDSDSADSGRAVTCLAQAVYYESARESELGQEAVAQVVLNRLRHPAYPKSVCGVVYQGAANRTGCQFTFTCDGSLGRPPEPTLWTRAQAIARQALSGFVVKEVGSATHYHAVYVAPYWAPTLVKMKQIGAHIFYRWTGPWGEPPAFTGRYRGGEADISPEILSGFDARTQGMFPQEIPAAPASHSVTLTVGGEARTYQVADPTALAAPGVDRPRLPGALYAQRRKPTPEEIQAINAKLEAMEKAEAAPVLTVPPPPQPNP